MPRHNAHSRISDAAVRLIAGRMIFAAAAEALGGLYGPIAMERTLAFSPSARAEKRALKNANAIRRAKRSLPTGTCKKWLEGHVPIDQTLALIAESNPKAARRMQQARDSDVLKALCVEKDNYIFVGNWIATLSPELWADYIDCIVLGHHKLHLICRFTAGLLHLAKDGKGANILIAIIGSDRQLPSKRGFAATRNLDKAFNLALDQAARTSSEIAFSKAAIAEAWSHRKTELERTKSR